MEFSLCGFTELSYSCCCVPSASNQMEQKFNLFLLLPTLLLLCLGIYYTFIHLKTRNEALNNFFTVRGRSINRERKRFFKRLCVIRNFTLISFIPPPTSRQNFITRFTNINQLWLTGAGEDKRNTRQSSERIFLFSSLSFRLFRVHIALLYMFFSPAS